MRPPPEEKVFAGIVMDESDTGKGAAAEVSSVAGVGEEWPLIRETDAVDVVVSLVSPSESRRRLFSVVASPRGLNQPLRFSDCNSRSSESRHLLLLARRKGTRNGCPPSPVETIKWRSC